MHDNVFEIVSGVLLDGCFYIKVNTEVHNFVTNPLRSYIYSGVDTHPTQSLKVKGRGKLFLIIKSNCEYYVY